MTLRIPIPSLASLRYTAQRAGHAAGNAARSLGRLIAFKGWQQAWAAGEDDVFNSGNAKITKPYEQSVWVFRAIQEIAGPLSSMPLLWLTQDGNDAAKRDPERDLFWRRPARTMEGLMSRNDFLEAIVVWMNLCGHAFIIMGDDWLAGRRGAAASPLILARPDRMRAVKSGSELLGWEFTDGAGYKHPLVREQVCRPHFVNPYDELEGLAPLKAAEIAAGADYAAGLFAKHLMESNGDRGAYVIAKQGATEEQRTQIEMALRQKRELNRRGIFKTMFLTGDITVEDPKVQSADTQFVAQRLQNRHEIYIAFGLPASMADIQASYSVGSASDRYRLIESTCMPTGARIAQHLETIEERRSGVKLECAFDWSQHSTMRAARLEMTKAARELFGMGVPLGEINDLLRLGLRSTMGDKIGWLPINLQRIEAVDASQADAKDEPQAQEQNAQQAGEELSKSLDKFAEIMRSAPQAQQRAEDDAAARQWRNHMALRAPHVKAIKTQINKALNKARKEMLQNLEDTKQLAEVKRRGVLEIMFDQQAFTLNMISLIKGPLTQSLQDAAQQFSEEIGLDDPWLMADPEAVAYVDTRENRIKDASAEIWQDVQGELQEGLTNGESHADIARRIREKFNGLSEHRSEVIAQTETGAAYGHARQSAMVATGITFKKWLTARDENVRAEHVRADGQIVAVSEAFNVAGELLQGPCDPNGSAANVINCRCVAVPTRDKPSDS